MNFLKSFFAFSILAFSISAFATIDSIGKYNFIYLQDIQEEPDFVYSDYVNNLSSDYNTIKSYCYGEAVFYDSISSSMYPVFQYMAEPFEAKIFGLPNNAPSSINLNELSNKDLDIIFSFDSISNYVETSSGNFIHEPHFVIDISKFSLTTIDERFKALTYAKLAILGIYKNLNQGENPLFKATIDIVGLPDQTDIQFSAFEKVYAKTNFPYSSGSPVVKKYETELISNFCR